MASVCIGENVQSQCKVDPWTSFPHLPKAWADTFERHCSAVLACRPAQPLLDAVPAGYRNSAGPRGLLKIWRRQIGATMKFNQAGNRNRAPHRLKRSPRFGRTTDGMLACHEIKLLSALMRSGVRKFLPVACGVQNNAWISHSDLEVVRHHCILRGYPQLWWHYVELPCHGGMLKHFVKWAFRPKMLRIDAMRCNSVFIYYCITVLMYTYPQVLEASFFLAELLATLLYHRLGTGE